MALISQISASEKTWENQLFITTDIDWACDEVIEFCFNFFNSLNIDVTWFATHKTKWNIIISGQENFEIGAHPNFNNVLLSEFNENSADKIIVDNLNIIPTTNLVRSHSVTVSSVILELYKENKLTIESNLFIPFNAGVEVKPFYHFNGILRVPYIWSDDVHMAYNWNYNDAIDGIINYRGIRVIDCHPIHIFLNTEKIERYNKAKYFLKDFDRLKDFQNVTNYGTRDFIFDLINQFNMKKNNYLRDRE